MKNFSHFLKQIREEAWISQDQLAKNLWVSTILITSIETGDREPSKKFINTFAKKLDVKAASILPFISEENIDINTLNGLEKKIIILIDELQTMLIKKKAHKLAEYV